MAESAEQKAVRARRGCMFYSLVAFLSLMLLVVAGGLIGYRVYKQTVRDYTATAPLALPGSSLSAAELQRVEERVQTFKVAVRDRQQTAPLELSVEELNALLAAGGDLKLLQDKVRVTALHPGKVEGLVSLPLDQAGLPAFRGRYLNGAATLDIAFSDGMLRVVPAHIVVNGKNLPKAYMDVLRHQNLARSLNTDAHASIAMNRLQDIKVQEGRLVIVPKAE